MSLSVLLLESASYVQVSRVAGPSSPPQDPMYFLRQRFLYLQREAAEALVEELEQEWAVLKFVVLERSHVLALL